MKPRQKRMAMIAGGLVALALAAALVLAAFRGESRVLFSPEPGGGEGVPQGRSFRVGGMVTPGSVKRQADGVTVQFVVTDTARTSRSSTAASSRTCSARARVVVTQGKTGSRRRLLCERGTREARRELHAPAAADAIKQAQSINEKAAHTLVQGGAGGK